MERFELLKASVSNSRSGSVEVQARGPGRELTRRDVLEGGLAAATVSAILSTGAARALARGGAGGGARRRERRDYLFDLSALDTRDHDLILVAGTRRFRLAETPPSVLRQLRELHPVLELVPDDRATHLVRGDFPASAIQHCYVQRVARAHGEGVRGLAWDLVLQFDHVPTSALEAGARLVAAGLGPGEHPPVPGKWGQFGLRGEDLTALADPVGVDVLKTSYDTACAMLAKHPEVISGDPDSYSYIAQKIVAPAPQTTQLGQIIELQGPIEPQSNWTDCSSPTQLNATGYGTNVPVCNPDTGEQAVNSLGQLQYVPSYSNETNEGAQNALPAILQQVKADPTLGANQATQSEQSSGTIYRYTDGTPTVDQTPSNPGSTSGLGYVAKNYSPGHGYSVEVTGVEEVDPPSTLTALVSVRVSNWYVRTLGLFVRYLDGEGNTLSIAQVGGEVTAALQQGFPLQNAVGSLWNTADDYFLDLLNPEQEVLGIPTSSPVKTLVIPVPVSAVSFEVLASGMGNTPLDSNPYKGTTFPGATMTGLFNLSMPTFFLALNAASGVGSLLDALSSDTQTMLDIFPLVMDLFADSFEAIGFSDPAAFEGLAKDIGQMLLTSGATKLVEFVVKYLAEGETEQDLLDAIPVVGGFIAMVQALGTVVTIAESSTQVMQSPSTYRFQVTLTHAVDVAIAGDPDNAGNWPSTAQSFKVVLLFDGGTPTMLTQSVPAQTVDSLTASFTGVPLGGLVTASVQVSSDTGFQVAQASAGPFDNEDPVPGQPLVLRLTLTENQVPLTSSTVYSHKEVIALDAGGDHVWNPTASPPVQEPSGCTPASGQLCQLTGITVNTTAGAVGQSFESANDAVQECTSGASGQLHLFTNVAATATPQSGFFSSGCGFSSAPRLAYDVVGDPDSNFYLDTSTTGTVFQGGVIRQIRLASSTDPGFDAPDSNKAWGKLQFPSDSFLLHPGGKIVSVNATHSKIEVVSLPTAAVSDDLAPVSQTYGGKGLREGLMDGPTLAALAPDGTVLVLETGNARIQAFDLNANPARRFGTAKASYFFSLKSQPVTRYLDFAVEFEGYMYVLSEDVSSGVSVYLLDLYDPSGAWLASTPNFQAARMTVNYWRDVYTQNSHVLRLPNGDLPQLTEPAISHWTPSTP